MLGSNYWNGDTSLLFGVEHQALVSSRCLPETSRYSSSSARSTSKLYLVPCRGWAQRMEMLPALSENSPSFKYLQEHSSTFWWTVACPWHGLTTTLGFIAQQCSVLASSSLTVLFIADAAPLAAGEVMTLSPHGNGVCSMCIIKGDDINLSDSRRLCRLCINDA
jgi:hypothetical protein